jgi:antibiotic biosynthesis monooxygenase (ABM) superfamily enzyme
MIEQERESDDFKQAFGEARKLIEHWNEQYEDCKKELARTESYYCGLVDELQKALEWYADEANYEMVETQINEYSSETTFAAWTDSGERARTALQSIQGGDNQ